ncbi:MAG: LLM class flavin-dependent oxidoreductase [Actinomycetota bacterium]|nr:LLM class flavin-dependent oxidoreductase [Actinomycetota bacterium]
MTLDRLSGARVVLGVGLGSDTTGELDAFGEPTHRRERARLIDMGLDALACYWAGGEVGNTGVRFLPRPRAGATDPGVGRLRLHRSPLQRVAR